MEDIRDRVGNDRNLGFDLSEPEYLGIDLRGEELRRYEQVRDYRAEHGEPQSAEDWKAWRNSMRLLPPQSVFSAGFESGFIGESAMVEPIGGRGNGRLLESASPLVQPLPTAF